MSECDGDGLFLSFENLGEGADGISQHRKLNLQTKILLPLRPGIEPATV